MTTEIDKDTLSKAETAFIRARIRLLSSNPFFAHLLMKLPLRWMPNDGRDGGLSSTDGDSLFINPVTFLELTNEQRVTCLVHEVLHCAAGHLFRRGPREPERWNLAADIYIDNLIEAERFQPGPWEQSREMGLKSWGMTKAQFRDSLTEAIYEALPPPKPHGGQGQGKGGCMHGPGGAEGCFKEAPDSASRSEAEARWKQNVIEAGQLAGSTPGKWQELVKAAMPKPPFHLKLHEYLSRGLGGDTSWDSLNRRYLWQGLYLPTDTKVVMGRVAVMVDTSGSMDTDSQLKLAFGYIRAFREQHPCQLDLIQCDHDCMEDAQFHTYDEWEALPETFKVVGRGGTSFDPPFKLLREKRIEPRVGIYLTDGYGSCSEKAPAWPVLWVVIKGTREFKPPFGEVVYVE